LIPPGTPFWVVSVVVPSPGGVDEHEVRASMDAESSAKPAQLSMFLFIVCIASSIGWFVCLRI
jgi:hypothetical protein